MEQTLHVLQHTIDDVPDSKGLGPASLFSSLSLGGGPTMSKPSLFQSPPSSTLQVGK